MDFECDVCDIAMGIAVVVLILKVLHCILTSPAKRLVTYHPSSIEYTYDEEDEEIGPCAWKNLFADAGGNFQSPISLISCNALQVSVSTMPCLTFSHEYHMQPEGFTAFNDGHAVILTFRYCTGVVPKICGGPLTGVYKFMHAVFRWGPNDDEGSEHSIDCQRFSMELQIVHLRCEGRFATIEEAVDDGSILIISYLFQAGCTDNPFLKPLTNALGKILEPYTGTDIDPLPLSCVAPTFKCNYFAYCGSLTHPPCTEGVRWMIQAEPLAISYRQANKFRKICGCDGPISSNTRAVQNINARDVLYIM